MAHCLRPAVFAVLTACGTPAPPDYLLPPVAEFFADYPEFGFPSSLAADAVPAWAGGPRQRVFVRDSEHTVGQQPVTAYLFYLAGDRVVTVWAEDFAGRRSPEPIWQAPTWVNPDQ